MTYLGVLIAAEAPVTSASPEKTPLQPVAPEEEQFEVIDLGDGSFTIREIPLADLDSSPFAPAEHRPMTAWRADELIDLGDGHFVI
jgi:hypothetical protein